MTKVLWDRLLVSTWVIPTMISIASVLLASMLVNIEVDYDDKIWRWLDIFTIGPIGVRQVLSVTTGAMMTVTGVVFSISVVTLTLAANQFGSKVLRNYLAEPHNKIVLGLFIGCFLYGLIVLTSIDSSEQVDIPVLAFVVSLLFTIAAVYGLIYFIQKISNSIQADVIVASIAREMLEVVDGLDGKTDNAKPLAGESSEAETGQGSAEWKEAVQQSQSQLIPAPKSGYVEYVDRKQLMCIATDLNCLYEVYVRPGDFIHKGMPLACCYLTDAQTAEAELGEHCDRALAEAIAIGVQRTPLQDLQYAVDQLLQIAQRALSPGINDSFMAMSCVDWLAAALSCMASISFPSCYHWDDDKSLRLKTREFDFAGAADEIFNPLRQNARQNEMITIHLLKVANDIITLSHKKECVDIIFSHAERIYEEATIDFRCQQDKAAAEERFQALRDNVASKEF